MIDLENIQISSLINDFPDFNGAEIRKGHLKGAVTLAQSRVVLYKRKSTIVEFLSRTIREDITNK